MGPVARVWKILMEEYAKLDGDKVEDWKDGLDVLLVFVRSHAFLQHPI